ncbi:CPXCG motif-containing cysteine-rich protein [Humisphaera borealis]|nr:CPXCG motif-containing cysteine-rich protein [Humisphaera borealis]
MRLGSVVKTGKRKSKRRRRRSADEGSYVCPSCGEQIVIPLDRSEGSDQRYVEDCPVCCNPNVISVEYDPAWTEPRVWAEAE